MDKKEIIKQIKHIGLVTLTTASIISTGFSLVGAAKAEPKKLEAEKLYKEVIMEIAVSDKDVNTSIENSMNSNWSKFESGNMSLEDLEKKNSKITTQSNFESVINKVGSNENKERLEIFKEYKDTSEKEYDDVSRKFIISAGVTIAGIYKLNKDAKKEREELEKDENSLGDFEK